MSLFRILINFIRSTANLSQWKRTISELAVTVAHLIQNRRHVVHWCCRGQCRYRPPCRGPLKRASSGSNAQSGEGYPRGFRFRFI